jgi:hypothetical protein
MKSMLSASPRAGLTYHHRAGYVVGVANPRRTHEIAHPSAYSAIACIIHKVDASTINKLLRKPWKEPACVGQGRQLICAHWKRVIACDKANMFRNVNVTGG